MNTKLEAIKAVKELGIALGASIASIANGHPETRSSDPVFPTELARKLVRAGKHSLLRDLARLLETGASLPARLMVEVAEVEECAGKILDLFSSGQDREWRPAANSTGRLQDNSTELNFGENSSMLSSVGFVLDDHSQLRALAPGHGSRPKFEVTADSGVASALQSLQSGPIVVTVPCPSVAAAAVPAVAVPAVAAASVLDGPSTSAAAASVLGGSSSAADPDPFSTTTSRDPNVRRELEELKQLYHRGTDRKEVYTRLRGLYGSIT